MDCRYHKGDKVIVRPYLDVLKTYRMASGPKKGIIYYYVVDRMVEQAGKIFTIKDIDKDGKGYRLEEYPYSWTDEMFLDLAKPFSCQSLL